MKTKSRKSPFHDSGYSWESASAQLPPGAIMVGAHFSIEGGLDQACERAAALKATAMQIFCRNHRRWLLARLDDEEAAAFRAAVRARRIGFVAIHASYLVNIATADPVNYARSVEKLSAELEIARRIGADVLIAHPGSHLGCDTAEGIERVAHGCLRVFEAVRQGPKLLLETTAGGGSMLGSSFEELAAILEKAALPDRLGVCLDTCHIFAAGYDLRSEEAYARTMGALRRTVGIERVGMIHANDSLYDLGSRRDRHWHIGKGKIGPRGFRLLMRDARFARLAKIIETPLTFEGSRMDDANLRAIKHLARKEKNRKKRVNWREV